VKRTQLRRFTRLKVRAPMRRSHPLRMRSPHRKDRGELDDPAYLAYLRAQPCRVPGCSRQAVPHHLRHDERGASLGARIKDDRRAISLCELHHTGDMGIHSVPWKLRELLGCDDLKGWQDARLEEQRADYLRETDNQQRKAIA
jgi:hypothetical protein